MNHLSSFTTIALSTLFKTSSGCKSGQNSLPQPSTLDRSFPVPRGISATAGAGWNLKFSMKIILFNKNAVTKRINCYCYNKNYFCKTSLSFVLLPLSVDYKQHLKPSQQSHLHLQLVWLVLLLHAAKVDTIPMQPQGASQPDQYIEQDSILDEM